MPKHVRHELGPVMGLLLCSGFCALIYQTVWFRAFRLIFGASTFATAAVLAVFMAGLGVGSAILGSRADRAANPLRFYAHLELAIAVTSGITPILIVGVQWVYLRTGGSTALGGVVATILRLVLSAIVLAPPTIMMGGTLPAAARAVERRSDQGRHRLSALYGINTIGAVLGALASTFLLVEVFGTRLTLWLACLLNLLVGMIARAVSRSGTVVEENQDDDTDVEHEPPVALAASEKVEDAEQKKGVANVDIARARRVRRFAPMAAAISGGVFMLMELVWYRMLAPILGGSSYTFGLILAVALSGIGLGGFVYARSKRPATLTLFAITCGIEAAFIALPFAIGDRIAVLAFLLRPVVTSGFGVGVGVWAVIAIIVVFPAAIVSGAQFPLVIALYGKGESNVGRDVGSAYMANTLGAITGSIAGGFGLMPALSAPSCWRLVVAILSLTAIASIAVERPALIGPRSSGRIRRGFVLSLAIVASALALISFEGPTNVWRHSGIGAGRADRRMAQGSSPAMIARFLRGQRNMIRWEEDGYESTVAVGSGDGHAFIVNGKADGHAIKDAPTQVMSGMLGALLHPNPKNALVIGLGTGSTAGWLGAIPSMDRVDVVELEAATIRVARDCVDVNRNVLENPKVKLSLGDAREVLLTSSQNYDIIFSEPSNPYRAGVSSLYTKEFYTAAASRLRHDGYFVHWVQAYEVDAFAVSTVLVTLRTVFNYVTIWRTMTGDLLVIAQRTQPVIDVDFLRTKVKEDTYREALRVWETDSVEGVMTHFVADSNFADLMTQNQLGLVNEDDLNVLEFAYARSVGHHRGVDNMMSELALRLDMTRPLLRQQGGQPLDPIGVMEERWLNQTADDHSLNPPPSELPPKARGLGRVLSAYTEKRFAGSLAQWRALGREPRWLLERSFVAELGVITMAADAETLIDYDRSATERSLLRASLALQKNDLDGSIKHLEEGYTLARKDPWVRPKLLSSAIHMALALADARRDLAPRLYEMLSVPFAAEGHRDTRLAIRVRVGELIDAHKCSAALHDIEPAPYVQSLLETRVRCYTKTGDPLLKQAEAALRDFASYENEFAGGIPTPAPKPNHPLRISSDPKGAETALPANHATSAAGTAQTASDHDAGAGN
jgi:spermidine synthase